MNLFSPKKLLNSKWTKVKPLNNERHFIVTDIKFDENGEVIECIIEATGDPLFGVRHALMAIENAKHVIMVNVEADVLCGPYLNQKAIENNVVFSMAYGDQPALICELIDRVKTVSYTHLTLPTNREV